MNKLPDEWIDPMLELLQIYPTSKQDREEWVEWLNRKRTIKAPLAHAIEQAELGLAVAREEEK